MRKFNYDKLRSLSANDVKDLAKQAAKGNDHLLKYKLAVCQLYAQQMSVDAKAALDNLTAAAESGEAMPMVLMGFIHEHGLADKKNYSAAISCYAQAYDRMKGIKVTEGKQNAKEAISLMDKKYEQLVSKINAIIGLSIVKFANGKFSFSFTSDNIRRAQQQLDAISGDIATLGWLSRNVLKGDNDEEGLWQWRVEDTLLMPMEVLKAAIVQYLTANEILLSLGFDTLEADEQLQFAMARCLIDDDDATDNDYIIAGLRLIAGHDKDAIWLWRTGLWYEYAEENKEPLEAEKWYKEVSGAGAKALKRLQEKSAYKMLKDASAGSGNDCRMIAGSFQSNREMTLTWCIEAALRDPAKADMTILNASTPDLNGSVLGKEVTIAPYYKTVDTEQKQAAETQRTWDSNQQADLKEYEKNVALRQASMESMQQIEACSEQMQPLAKKVKQVLEEIAPILKEAQATFKLKETETTTDKAKKAGVDMQQALETMGKIGADAHKAMKNNDAKTMKELATKANGMLSTAKSVVASIDKLPDEARKCLEEAKRQKAQADKDAADRKARQEQEVAERQAKAEKISKEISQLAQEAIASDKELIAKCKEGIKNAKEINTKLDTLKQQKPVNSIPIWKKLFYGPTPATDYVKSIDGYKRAYEKHAKSLKTYSSSLEDDVKALETILKEKYTDPDKAASTLEMVNDMIGKTKSMNVDRSCEALSSFLETLATNPPTLGSEFSLKRSAISVLVIMAILKFGIGAIPTSCDNSDSSNNDSSSSVSTAYQSTSSESTSSSYDFTDADTDLAEAEAKAEAAMAEAEAEAEAAMAEAEAEVAATMAAVNEGTSLKDQLKKRYDYVYSFDSNGLAKVEKGDKKGFVNQQGVEVLKPMFTYIYSWDSDGWAKVEIGDKKGFIVLKGGKIDIVVKPKYDYIYSWDSDGWAKVEIGDKKGFIDRKGREVVPPVYDYIYSFSGGLAKVEKNGKTGYINREGKLVSPLQ